MTIETTDALRARGAQNAGEADRAAELEQRRQALAQNRTHFAHLEPEGRRLLDVFTRANFTLGIETLRAALASRSGIVLSEAIRDWAEQADTFAAFGLQAAAAPPPRMERTAELDEAAQALREAREKLAAFDAEPYALADVTDGRIVEGIRLRERVLQLETLTARLQRPLG